MNKKITTLLFDLDGTLIDTNNLIVTSVFAYVGNILSWPFHRGRCSSLYGTAADRSIC